MKNSQNHISILIAKLLALIFYFVDYKLITPHTRTYHQLTYISPVFFKLIKNIKKRSINLITSCFYVKLI